MKVPFLDLSRYHSSIKPQLLNAFEECVDNSNFVSGNKVKQFEENFSTFEKGKYGIGVSTGADALFLVQKALGIGSGDEVITVNNTFNATVDSIIRTGANPKVVDVSISDFLMDVDQLSKAVNDKTKAIIPVHLYGKPARLDYLEEFCSDHDLYLIQDSAQAHGAKYNNKSLGEFGEASCYSFYPGKNLGALGEGGMIVTDNDELMDKLNILRNACQKEKYFHEYPGFNARMHEIQGAFLNIKLKDLEKNNALRNSKVKLYKELMGNDSLFQLMPQGVYSSYHLLVLQAKNRSALIDILKENSIGFGIHYPVPINKANAYCNFEISKQCFPISEVAAKNVISLPIFAELTDTEISFVCEVLKNYKLEFLPYS